MRGAENSNDGRGEERAPTVGGGGGSEMMTVAA